MEATAIAVNRTGTAMSPLGVKAGQATFHRTPGTELMRMAGEHEANA